MNAAIQQAARLIDAADALLICAGAGMSVDSGLPDFRGLQGLWQSHADMASAQCFLANPLRSWAFYGRMLQDLQTVEPHAGYDILRQLAASKRYGGFVFTRNVDGLFQKAGFANEQVFECHGSLYVWQCAQPCCEATWAFELSKRMPRCPRCGGLARPNVLLFEDETWLPHPTMAGRARLQTWLKQAKNFLTIEIGAGTVIPTVRDFASKQPGALIRINVFADHAQVRKKDVGLEMGALVALQSLGLAL